MDHSLLHELDAGLVRLAADIGRRVTQREGIVLRPDELIVVARRARHEYALRDADGYEALDAEGRGLVDEAWEAGQGERLDHEAMVELGVSTLRAERIGAAPISPGGAFVAVVARWRGAARLARPAPLGVRPLRRPLRAQRRHRVTRRRRSSTRAGPDRPRPRQPAPPSRRWSPRRGAR